MKRCPQCNQFFDDVNDYCLNDGTPLMFDNASQPTVVWTPPTSNPPKISRGATTGGSNTSMFVMFGIILLLAVVAVGFAVAYFMGSRDDGKNSNHTAGNAEINVDKTNPQSSPIAATPERPVVPATPKIETVRPPGARGGLVHRPPSNVRFAPNGAVLCTVKSRSTINIYGDTGVYDNNGLWYYTDVCGRQGVIHSTQFQFTK